MSTSPLTGWESDDPLAWVLAPVTVKEFLDGFWERKLLVVPRADPSYYDDRLTFEDVNSFLCRNDIRYPYLRLVKNGRELPLVDYADDFVYGANIFPGLLDQDKVFQHYAQGATLSFQIFQKCLSSLSSFCNSLEARLRFQTQVNIFVTPPRSRGFTAHYDDHSFFILQISGSKNWKIYGSPVPLPLQEFRRDVVTPQFDGPTAEVTLKPGDLLYLPRGFYHEAHTDEDTSVHITLGIFPYTWLQIIERQLQKMKQDVDFRRAPADQLRTESEERTVRMQRQFLSLIEKIATADPCSLLDDLSFRAASKQIVDAHDRLRDLVNLDRLSPDSRIRRRKVLCRTEEVQNGLKLSFYDKSITFPMATRDGIDFILQCPESFSVRDMPQSVDPASAMTIARALLKEGLLAFEA